MHPACAAQDAANARAEAAQRSTRGRPAAIHLRAMRFRITSHTGYDAPADAMDQLLASLSGHRSKGRFRKVGREIRVVWGSEDGGWDRPERRELEREQVLDLIRERCREESSLSADWYAVGPLD